MNADGLNLVAWASWIAAASAMLILAVAVQSAPLRNPKVWNGVGRRQSDDHQAEGDAP